MTVRAGLWVKGIERSCTASQNLVTQLSLMSAQINTATWETPKAGPIPIGQGDKAQWV